MYLHKRRLGENANDTRHTKYDIDLKDLAPVVHSYE